MEEGDRQKEEEDSEKGFWMLSSVHDEAIPVMHNIQLHLPTSIRKNYPDTSQPQMGKN